jgi:choline dehydrogenase-like flavoprotein
MSATEEFTAKTYDYVIVGGGTAGLTLAARLSENPDVSVAVLEAGEAHLNDPQVMTPGLCIALYDNPDYDWSFKTVPQVSISRHPNTRRKGRLTVDQNRNTPWTAFLPGRAVEVLEVPV